MLIVAICKFSEKLGLADPLVLPCYKHPAWYRLRVLLSLPAEFFLLPFSAPWHAGIPILCLQFLTPFGNKIYTL